MEDAEQPQPVCIEDLPVVSFDAFFSHFSSNKSPDHDLRHM